MSGPEITASLPPGSKWRESTPYGNLMGGHEHCPPGSLHCREIGLPYDDGLAQRVREILDSLSDLEEKRMFGGLAFMLRGNMCCGVIGSTLMVRVGPRRCRDALNEPHVREMDFTGKPLRGFVYVDPDGIDSDRDLQAWIDRALQFVETLPAK